METKYLKFLEENKDNEYFSDNEFTTFIKTFIEKKKPTVRLLKKMFTFKKETIYNIVYIYVKLNDAKTTEKLVDNIKHEDMYYIIYNNFDLLYKNGVDINIVTTVLTLNNIITIDQLIDTLFIYKVSFGLIDKIMNLKKNVFINTSILTTLNRLSCYNIPEEYIYKEFSRFSLIMDDLESSILDFFKDDINTLKNLFSLMDSLVMDDDFSVEVLKMYKNLKLIYGKDFTIEQLKKILRDKDFMEVVEICKYNALLHEYRRAGSNKNKEMIKTINYIEEELNLNLCEIVNMLFIPYLVHIIYTRVKHDKKSEIFKLITFLKENDHIYNSEVVDRRFYNFFDRIESECHDINVITIDEFIKYGNDYDFISLFSLDRNKVRLILDIYKRNNNVGEYVVLDILKKYNDIKNKKNILSRDIFLDKLVF